MICFRSGSHKVYSVIIKRTSSSCIFRRAEPEFTVHNTYEVQTTGYNNMLNALLLLIRSVCTCRHDNQTVTITFRTSKYERKDEIIPIDDIAAKISS